MKAPLRMAPALDIALALAEAGFYVFPSWAKDRHIPGWPQRATRDAAQIRAWFTGPYAACWPSIYTGRHGDGSRALLAVDVDPRGKAAIESRALDALLPETRMHRTPRGGFHGFYRVPFPGVKQGVNVLADGVDIRSKGGLVHFGEGYTLEQDEPIAEAPAALIERCGGAAPVTAPADRAQDRIAPDQEAAMQRAEEFMRDYPRAAEGERNGALHLFICKVRESCATDADSTMLIGLAFADAKCDPPYPEDEARATIKSAIRSAQNAAGSKALLPSDWPVLIAQPQAEAPHPAPVAQAVAGVLGRRLPSMADVLTRRTERRPYLIKGVLLAGTYAEIFGASGEGKTFLALDIAHCIGGGERAAWHGRPVAHGPVLYLALEGAGGLGERLQALAQEFGPARDLYVADGGRYDLCSPAGREALGVDIAATFGDRKPVLIVVDTLARALALSGRDENSAQDIGLLNASAGGLIAATGAAVVVIHHSGKDKSKGARGSSALYAALDTELEIEGGRITATKQRDLPEGHVLDFKLRPVPVGADADGDPVTSCVIEEAAGRARAPWKPTGHLGDAWRVLCDLRPDNAPLTEEEWRGAFAAKAWPVDPPGAASQAREWRRVVKALAEAGKVEGTPNGWQRVMA